MKGFVDRTLFWLGYFYHSGWERVYFRGMYLGSSCSALSVIGFASSMGAMS